MKVPLVKLAEFAAADRRLDHRGSTSGRVDPALVKLLCQSAFKRDPLRRAKGTLFLGSKEAPGGDARSHGVAQRIDGGALGIWIRLGS